MNIQLQPDFGTAERLLRVECAAMVLQGGGALGESQVNEAPEVQSGRALPKGSSHFSLVYNLFRHRLAQNLVCAVPEDCPVPAFIEPANWTFDGTTEALAQEAFDPEAARTVVRFNGFCLLLAPDGRDRGSASLRTISRLARRLRTTMQIRSASGSIAL